MDTAYELIRTGDRWVLRHHGTSETFGTRIEALDRVQELWHAHHDEPVGLVERDEETSMVMAGGEGAIEDGPGSWVDID